MNIDPVSSQPYYTISPQTKTAKTFSPSPQTIVDQVNTNNKKTINRNKIPINTTPSFGLPLDKLPEIIEQVYESPRQVEELEIIPSPKSSEDPPEENKDAVHYFSHAGLSMNGCLFLKKIAESTPYSGKLSLFINMVHALHQECTSFLKVSETTLRVPLLSDNIEKFQRDLYSISYFFLMEEIVHNYKKKNADIEKYLALKKTFPSFEEISNAFFIQIEHLRNIVSSKSMESEFFARFKNVNLKLRMRETFNNAHKESVERLEKIKHAVLTMQEVLKLPENILSDLCSNEIEEVVLWNNPPSKSLSIKECWDSFQQCFFQIFQTVEKRKLSLGIFIEKINYIKLFGYINQECKKTMDEEEFSIKLSSPINHYQKMEVICQKSRAIYEQSKTLTPEQIKQQFRIEKQPQQTAEDFEAMLLQSYLSNSLFMNYAADIINGICFNLQYKYVSEIAYNALLDTWEKLIVLEDEESFQLILILIKEFTRKFNFHFSQEGEDWKKIEQSFLGIENLIMCKNKILNKIEDFISNYFSFDLWKETKDGLETIKKDIIRLSNTLVQGCQGIENILTSSPLSKKDFESLKDMIIPLTEDLDKVLRPLMDILFIFDTIFPFQKENRADLEGEKNVFTIDFDKICEKITFLEEELTEEGDNRTLQPPIVEKSVGEIVKPFVGVAVVSNNEDCSFPLMSLSPASEIQQKPIKKSYPKNREISKKMAPQSNKVKKLLKPLFEEGYTIRRIRGSHLILKKGNSKSVPIPINKTHLAKGTLNKILVQTNQK